MKILGQEKIALVTGGNSGIGLEIAKGLARNNCHVIIQGRDEVKGEKAKKKILEVSNNGKVELMLADFSTIAGVKKFICDFKAKYEKLHILMNNAGLQKVKRHINEDGIELTFMVNYLSQVILTLELYDLLQSSATKDNPSRIVFTSSFYHDRLKINIDDINCEKIRYNGMNVYKNTKLFQIMFTYYYTKELKDNLVTLNVYDPGYAETDLPRDSNVYVFLSKVYLGIILNKTPQEAAQTGIYLALAKDVAKISGYYFQDKQIVESSELSYDKELQEKLWKITEEKINGQERKIKNELSHI